MQIEQHLAEMLPPVLLLSANCASCVVEEFHGIQMEGLKGLFLRCLTLSLNHTLVCPDLQGKGLLNCFSVIQCKLSSVEYHPKIFTQRKLFTNPAF